MKQNKQTKKVHPLVKHQFNKWSLPNEKKKSIKVTFWVSSHSQWMGAEWRLWLPEFRCYQASGLSCSPPDLSLPLRLTIIFYLFAPQAFFYPLPISISLHLVTSSASLSPSPPCILMQVKGAGEERGRWVHSRVSATAPSQRVKNYEQRRSGRLRDIE